MDFSLAILIFAIGFAVSILSGLLGIGGGIVMAPALLYLPPALGVGTLEMKQVTGLTITQALFACLSGALGHHRRGYVHWGLVVWMGACLFSSALAGSFLSGWASNRALMALFAALAVVASVLICVPKKDGEGVAKRQDCSFNRIAAIGIALSVGFLGGLVGQGGSFILIPLMHYLLRLPTRVVIGSNLALVFFSSLAAFAGKVITGQVPTTLALALVLGALPGAQLGSLLSHRTSPHWLRIVLAAAVSLAALRITADVIQTQFFAADAVQTGPSHERNGTQCVPSGALEKKEGGKPEAHLTTHVGSRWR